MEEATGQAAQGDNLAGFLFFPVQVLIEPGVNDRIMDVLRWAISIASVPLTEAPQPVVAT